MTDLREAVAFVVKQIEYRRDEAEDVDWQTFTLGPVVLGRLRDALQATQEPTDPLLAGGAIVASGPGPHEAIIDPRRAVLHDDTHVALAHLDGERMAVAVALAGRVNKTDERAKVLFLTSVDGAASIAAELINLGVRAGPDFKDRMLDAIQQGLDDWRGYLESLPDQPEGDAT